MFIYRITNAVNGKIYVGQHKGGNLRKYLQGKFSDALGRRQKGRSHLFNAIRKHGRENFSIEPLARVHGDMPKLVLDSLETFCITFLNARNPEKGYNICRGGEGHTGPISDEVKAKWHAGNKKYWNEHKHDLIGKVFGKLTVLSEAESRKDKRSWKSKRLWNCQCSCGNNSVVETSALLSGGIQSCGCLISEAGKLRWAKQEMIGKVFGKLTVQSEAGRNKSKQRMWNCLCTCGNRTVVKTNSLMMGNTQSCGCGNSSKGLKWMHKDKKEIRVKQTDVETRLAEGWALGQAFPKHTKKSVASII